MWPFDLFDDSPEWVKAAGKRFKIIENFTIENIPDIRSMPIEYQYMYNKPMKIEEDKYGCVKYILGVKRFAGVGSHVGVCLGYYIIKQNIHGDYVYKDFEYFYWHENDLDYWKKELSEQLPDFFCSCNYDIEQKLRSKKTKKEVDKRNYKRSVDQTLDIINCLKSRVSSFHDN
jgi:hypothetical protein